MTDTARLAPDSLPLNRAEIARGGSAFELTDTAGGERLTVTAKAIVNATGAWLDSAIARLDASASVRPDDVVDLTVDLQKMHFFDLESGASIRS